MSFKKYFVAVVIPPPLQQKIVAIKQQLFLQHGLKGALRSPAHITLHRPFEWKEEKEEQLMETLKTFQFKDAFEITLNNFTFFEPRVIYVQVQSSEPLFELHRQLTAFAKLNLKLFNEAEDARGFHPHVTVAFRDLKKPKFYELQQEFMREQFSGAFDYAGFALLKLEKKWEEHCFFKL